MQFYYGSKNILRALDEAEFWKHQEAEHAELIPVVVPNLEPVYTEALARFNRELSQMQAESVKYIESVTRSKGMIGRGLQDQMYDFIRRCLEQSEKFVQLLEEMLKNSRAVHSLPPAVHLLNHMIRESKYFIGIAQLVLY